jgi:hypothetical protein
MVLLPLPLECWDCRCDPPHAAVFTMCNFSDNLAVSYCSGAHLYTESLFKIFIPLFYTISTDYEQWLNSSSLPVSLDFVIFLSIYCNFIPDLTGFMQLLTFYHPSFTNYVCYIIYFYFFSFWD